MKTSDTQIVIEKRFLVMTMIIVLLLVIASIVVALNWRNWFGTDLPANKNPSSFTEDG